MTTVVLYRDKENYSMNYCRFDLDAPYEAIKKKSRSELCDMACEALWVYLMETYLHTECFSGEQNVYDRFDVIAFVHNVQNPHDVQFDA